MTGGARRVARRVPLWLWAAGVALSIGVLVTTGCAVGVVVAGRMTGAVAALVVGLGALGTAVAVAAASLAADNAADALRSLRDEAVQRLRDPDAALVATRQFGVRATAEMSDLTEAVEALALRMRVADELALRHRRSAETASAGMFELLSGLIAAEEAARGQLAAELHDTVAQSLSVARTALAAGNLEQATAYLEEAEDQTRAVMARTRPPALRTGDLADAVSTLRDDLHQRYGLRVSLSWPDSPRPLPLATAVTVYRFFQEGLLNIVKHADVDDAAASLSFEGDQLAAQVSDAGPGFVPGEVRSERGRHVGLGLLRERVRLAGGSLEVTSAPGQGTRLLLSVPLGPVSPEGGPAQTSAPSGLLAARTSR